MRLQKITKLKNLLIGTTLILSLSTTTAQAMFFNNDKPKVYNPPVSVPFDLTKKGNNTEVLVEIEEDHYYYSFELLFFYDNPMITTYTRIMWAIASTNHFIGWIVAFIDAPISKIKEKFGKKYTKEEYRELKKDMYRVRELVGYNELIQSGSGDSYKSEWIKHPGITTPVHLTVAKLEKDGMENIVLDEIVDDLEKTQNTSDHFYGKINLLRLTQGTYKFKIESLKDSPEFIGTKIHLRIAKPGGKR